MRPGARACCWFPRTSGRPCPRTSPSSETRRCWSTIATSSQLEIEDPKGSVTLAQEDKRWSIIAPEALAADPAEVGAVLSSLRDPPGPGLPHRGRVGHPAYLAKPGCGSRSPTTAAGPRPAPGPSPERRGDQPSAYAAVAERGPVVLVDGSALDDLGRTAHDLRDRASRQPRTEDVQRVTSSGAARRWCSSERARGNGAWWSRPRGRRRAARSTPALHRAGPPVEGSRGAPRRGCPPLWTRRSRDGVAWTGPTAANRHDPGRQARGERVFVRTKASPAIYAMDAAPARRAPERPRRLQGLSGMTAWREIYLKQMELGPMQNFVYLVGDPWRASAWWWIPRGRSTPSSTRPQRDGMALVGALVTHTHQDHVGAAWRPGACPGASRAGRSRSSACPSRSTSTRPSANPHGIGSDLVMVDGDDTLAVGRLTLTFLHTPGHTPGSHASWSTAGWSRATPCSSALRRDGPSGERSHRDVLLSDPALAALPDETILLPGHNYGGPLSTIGDENATPSCASSSLGDFLRRWACSIGRRLGGAWPLPNVASRGARPGPDREPPIRAGWETGPRSRRSMTRRFMRSRRRRRPGSGR